MIAPILPRFGAYLIDLILVHGGGFLLQLGIEGILFLIRRHVLHQEVVYSMLSNSGEVEQVIGFLLSLAILYYYYVPYQLKHGTSIGKKVFSLYVVDAESGEPMSKRQALLRLCAYLPSYLILGCGFLMAAFHPERKALHDVLAGTICIKKQRS